METANLVRRSDDPSALTTQQLLRELGNLSQVLTSRIDGIEKIQSILQRALDDRPDVITKEIEHLQKLHQEKFSSVDKQFIERDARVEQAAGAVKIAVDAALQAQKEAVGKQQEASDRAITKSEVATTKQIDQIGVIIQTNTNNTNDKFDDVKTRLNLMDGIIKGGKEHKDDSRANIAIGVSVLMMVMTIGGILYAEKSPPTVTQAQQTPQQPQVIYMQNPSQAQPQAQVQPPKLQQQQ